MKCNKIKHIKQHDISDCGPACIAMLLQYYGSKVSIANIREVAGTDTMGTNLMGMQEALNFYGFDCKMIKAELSDLSSDKLPFPAIAHIIKNEGLLHYVLVLEISDSKVVYMDPETGKEILSFDEFKKMWTNIIIFSYPNDKYNRIDEKQKNIFSLLKYNDLGGKNLLSIGLASIFSLVIGVITSFYFQIVIDDVFPSNDYVFLNIITIAFIISYLLQSLFEFFRSKQIMYVGNNLSYQLIDKYFSHVINLPLSFFQNRKNGEIISRFIDASKIVESMLNVFLSLTSDLILLIVVSVVMIMFNYKLFILAFLTIPVYCLIILGFVKSFDKTQKEELKTNAQLNSYIIESLNGIETIKALKAEDRALNIAENKLLNYIASQVNSFNCENSQVFLKKSFHQLSTTLILLIATKMILNSELTLGQLITYNTLLNYFVSPLTSLINLQPKIQVAKVAYGRLNEILLLQKENLNEIGYDLTSKKIEKIEFNQVYFKYKAKKPLLKNINLTINAKDKIAIKGKSGSGKSTLAKLLVNLYQPMSGNIKIDGIDIRDISLESLRDSIEYLPQSSFFFEGTILENLTFGLSENIPMEKIIEVCRISQLDEIISNMSMRFLTKVSENASDLSGGEKQRLALARALLKNPQVLILDEATSNIDHETEMKIMEKILSMDDKTVIVISHKVACIEKCSRIFDLEVSNKNF